MFSSKKELVGKIGSVKIYCEHHGCKLRHPHGGDHVCEICGKKYKME